MILLRLRLCLFNLTIALSPRLCARFFCVCLQMLSRIGHVHFGIKPPQEEGLMGMLGQLMGGM